MPLLQGLPDFYQPFQTADFQIFYPYEGLGSHFLLPQKLVLAERANNQPDFQLEYVSQEGTSQAYGWLDLRVVPHYELESALKTLRDRIAGSSLIPLHFTRGFLHFNVETSIKLIPIPLDWNELGQARCRCKLSLEAATFIERALQGEILALDIVAEMEILGVSPRLPIQVSFDPAKLLQTLVRLGDSKRQIARQTIVDFFSKSSSLTILNVQGDLDAQSQRDFAETMSDRVCERFGRFIPAPNADKRSYLSLVAPEEVGSGRIDWDLAEPIVAARSLTLSLNGFEVAQQLVKQEGLQAVIKETIVPPVATGILPVSVLSNLPAEPLLGVLEIGATLRLDPKRPFRPQAQVKTIALQPSQTVALKFSPIEPESTREYKVSTYVALQTGDQIRQLESEPQSHRGDLLYLNPNDFPVNFFSIKAEKDLLAISTLKGKCFWEEDAIQDEILFELSSAQPWITLTLPKLVKSSMIEIQAISYQDLKNVTLKTLLVQSLQLDVYSFPEYGSQTVEIECVFERTTQAVIFEFLPEGIVETPEVAVPWLYFHPNQPKQKFTWFAASLFQSRYRYRRKSRDNRSMSSPWSDYCSPFEPLILHV
jgi:hypothetical protein